MGLIRSVTGWRTGPSPSTARAAPSGILPTAVAKSPSALLSLSSASAKKALPLGWFTTGASWNASYDVVLGGREARIAGEAVIELAGCSRWRMRTSSCSPAAVSRAASAGDAVAYDAGVAEDGHGRRGRADSAREEAAGGFHLYSLPGRANIRAGTTTTVQLFEPAPTAYEKRLVMRSQMPWYGYIPQQPDEQVVPVEVSYILKRPLKTPFGDKPLPGGVARIYNPDSEGRLQLVGEAVDGITRRRARTSRSTPGPPST